MKTTLLRLAVLMLCAACAFSQERYSKVSIPVSSVQDVIRLAKLGINLEGAAHKSKEHIDVFVSEQEIQLLKENGIGFTTLIPDWYAYYTEQQKHETQPASALLRKSSAAGFHLGSMGGFLTYEELRADLDSMRAKYPALITARDSIGSSCENRPIWAVRISKSPIQGALPQALYMGCHHANEPAGMMSVIYFMWYILEKYGTDPEVTTLLDTRELWFVPLVNPDGYCYNQQRYPAGGGQWRWNREPVAPGVFGVDLNRNYSFKWGFDDIGSSPDPKNTYYRGKAPFSEPETQAIRNFIQAKHFTMAHSYHTSGDFVSPPWAYTCTETPDSVLIRALELDMTALNGYSIGAEYPYTCNGEAGDWMYGDTLSKPKIIPFTVEVGADADGVWPPLSRILPLAMENVRTNLVLAHAAGNYIRVDRSHVACQFTTDSAIVAVPFINSGVSNAVTTLDINISCPHLGIATTHYSGYLWSTSGPLRIPARKNKPVGTKVSMVFEINYQGGRTVDTVTFRLGPAQVLYADNAEGTRSRWSASTSITMQWDTTDEQAHSGRLSFSESPHGVYQNLLISTFMLDSALVLKGTAAELRFWLKGRVEDDEDCLRAEISTDGGGTWISLAGRYTSPGAGGQYGTQSPFQSPVLDGYKYEWVEEAMDLTEHVGKTIKLRFRFTSDYGIAYDGFYIDDISVLTYGTLSYAHDIVMGPLTPRKQQDTVRIRAIVDNPLKHNLTLSVKSTDLSTGKTQDSVLFFNDGLHGDSIANDNIWGTYFVPMVEGIYSVTVAVDDPAGGTSWRLPNAGFFASAGPIGFDKCTITSSDTIPNPGDLMTFTLSLRNRGSTATVQSVTATVTCLDSNAVPQTGLTYSYGDIPPGAAPIAATVYRVRFRPTCPVNYSVRFTIDISSNGKFFWRDTFYVKVLPASVTAVNSEEGIPKEFGLSQNYPNPFNPSTRIDFQLPVSSHVTLKVFDILGREVALLVNEIKTAGIYHVSWDAANMPSGMYVYRITTGNFVCVRKMVLVR